MTATTIRLAGGQLDGQEFTVDGHLPPATVDVTDIFDSHVYLRTYAPVPGNPDAWLYVPSSTRQFIPVGFTKGSIPCNWLGHLPSCVASQKAAVA